MRLRYRLRYTRICRDRGLDSIARLPVSVDDVNDIIFELCFVKRCHNKFQGLKCV